MEDSSRSPEPEDAEPSADDARRPWREGPDEEAPEESWLALDDDALLLQVETLGAEVDKDDQLLEVVASDRHFFLRQEAAKRVRDRTRLFAFEDDRHVGQILVRHLNRREDLTYLERLSLRSRHVEVRSAAQVQLARVWKKLECPPTHLPAADAEAEDAVAELAEEVVIEADEPTHAVDPAASPVWVLSGGGEGVDGSLLSWAAHFIVEAAWSQLGTHATHELLRRTKGELAPACPTLAAFVVSQDARVTGDLPPGARMPREAVQQLATWMTAFLQAAAKVAPDLRGTSVRGCTSLMADALRQVGFYAACDEAEARRAG
jgi:hypothetical protein